MDSMSSPPGSSMAPHGPWASGHDPTPCRSPWPHLSLDKPELEPQICNFLTVGPWASRFTSLGLSRPIR